MSAMSGLLPPSLVGASDVGGAPAGARGARGDASGSADGARRAERFVLRSHIVPLLDVLLENREAYTDVMSGRTHAGKYAARVKLVRKLIARDESTRPCFGPDPEIERQNGTNEKIKDILRVLKQRYVAVARLADGPAPRDENDPHLRRAMESFAGVHYDDAKRKADLLFRAASADTDPELPPPVDHGIPSPSVSASPGPPDDPLPPSPPAPLPLHGPIPARGLPAFVPAGRVSKRSAPRAPQQRSDRPFGPHAQAERRERLAQAVTEYFASLEPDGDGAYVCSAREAEMRAALVEEKLKQERTKFGIEIYSNTSLAVKLRIILLRKHGCDELADALETEEHGAPELS